jgi:hypothetical protein
VNTACQFARTRLAVRLVARRAGLALLALALLSPAALAYVVKLKDGSLVFARAPYTVKGKRAIITLENGTVTQIDLAKIDEPGTVQYNKDNPGNVIALDTPEEKVVLLPTPIPRSNRGLQELARQRRQTLDAPTPGPGAPAQSGGSAGDPSAADPALQTAFARVFEGAGISQDRVVGQRGKTRLLASASSEQAVFNTLSAAARAVLEAANRGRPATVDIVLTTPSGEAAGTFEMTPAQARMIVDRSITVQDYFVKNVIF